MAGTDRNTPYTLAQLLESLKDKPYAYGFFQAMRLMECLHPDRPRLGMSRQPCDDPIRLGQEPSPAFEAASLTRFESGEGGKPHRLMVRFLGLFGPNGPLPLHLTEYAYSRLKHHRDETFSRFMDIFHHRMFCLFYRAWANSEPTVSYDRPTADPFSDYVGSLAGLGMSALRQRDDMPDSAKLYYIGRLANQTKSADGLEAMLKDFFGLPAKINGFIGEWVDLPQQNICRLGQDLENATLNDSIVLGQRFWCCQHKFRIIMGPLNFEDYTGLLPIGKSLQRLTDMVRNYIGDELVWDLKLILKKEEVPVARLNRGSLLGWTTWLDNRTKEEDAQDLILTPSLS
nr:type VI secretion system baseplate subunit TssG [uncultured Desulfobacter sp.]